MKEAVILAFKVLLNTSKPQLKATTTIKSLIPKRALTVIGGAAVHW